VVAKISHQERVIHLGSYATDHPEAALGWLRSQAARLSNALSPCPGIGPLPREALHRVIEETPDPGHIFREWIWDYAVQERQLTNLASGRAIGVHAGDAGVIYSLTAEPIRQPTNLDATLQLSAVV
jgi:hypothetical protein